MDFFYDRISQEYQVIWTDITKDEILSGKFHNDELINVKAIVESDLSTTEAVAIDWIGRNLYWIDSTLKHIGVSTKEGLHRTTLISENISKPRSMAIDSRFGYLFWSDWEEEEPRIERSTLAGEERSAIFNLKQIGGAWPNGITLDYVKKRIFFLDARSKEIHTVDYSGAKHQRILKNLDYLHHPFAITIYENNVFWTDWRLGSVVKADKFTGANVTIFHQSSTQPFDIKVMHPSRQPWDYNGEGQGKIIISPCENTNCSHLCLLSKDGLFKCACPHMMRLNNANKAVCEKVDEILFYITNKPEIRAVELKHPMSNAISTIYHTQLIMAPSQLSIHPRDNRIFWADLQLREIKSVKLSTSVLTTSQKIETILDSAVHDVQALAIDYRSGLMYIAQSTNEEDETERIMGSSEGGHRLLVGNLNGEYLSVLMANINAISSLIVASQERKIFFSISEQKEDEIRYLIYQCGLDGSNNTLLIFEDEVVESLTFDASSRRLYFLKNNRKIFYFDLKLQKTELVNTYYGAVDDKFTDLFITSLEIYKNSIYFGENTTSTIRVCNKNSCRVPEIYRNNTKNIRQIKILALSEYNDDAENVNGCMLHNGRCDHLCIPLEGSEFVCKCSIGYSIDPQDGKKCIGSDDVIVYSLGYELKGLLIKSTETNALTPLQRVNVISSVDFDIHNDFIYVSDSERGEITRIKRDGSSRQTVIATPDTYEHSPTDWLGDIAVDWIGQNLYWTDQKRGLIEVSRLDGSYRRVVSSQLFKPSLIEVDPLLGIMFYVDGENIVRRDLDGGNNLIISKMSSSVISDMTLDIHNQLIYVCEMRKNL